MHDHERHIRGETGGDAFKVNRGIATKDDRRLGLRERDRRLQTSISINRVGPHAGTQPANLERISEIDRIDVEADTLGDRRHRLRYRPRVALELAIDANRRAIVADRDQHVARPINEPI